MANPRQLAAKGPNVIYSRVNIDRVNDMMKGTANELLDNTFEAKAKFGEEGDIYGVWSNERLKDKKGKFFQKEKQKMKNKNFHKSGANAISAKVNSVKFN